MMAGSISQQLEDLLNPLPKYADPEDDQDEETKAKIIEEFNEDDDGEAVGASVLRKRNTSLLSETDGRYLGKPVSRKQLLEDIGESEDNDDDDGDEDDVSKEETGDSEADGTIESGDEVEDEEDEEEESEEEPDALPVDAAQVKTLVYKMKGTNITAEHPTEIDLHKLTDGMDDVGESEEDESDEDDGSEADEMDEEDEDEDENQETMRTFSKEKVDEQVEKGKAVKDQLALWDQVLEGRIKLQKALVTANQLPQPATYPEFKERGGAEFAGALKNSHKAVKALQRSLLELQDQLLYQNPETRPISLGKTWGGLARCDDDEDISEEEEEEAAPEAGPPKRKLEMSEYPDFMAKRFAAFRPYRDATLQKWHDRTRLTAGGKGGRGFAAFDRSILTQVEQVLSDNDRLVRRTQTRRSDYRVLGKREAPQATTATTTTTVEDRAEEEPETTTKATNAHLKDLDEDIFDDDDFYHQLLRELIERKTSAADPNDQVAMGRQWLAIQKLRSKIKKKVDTKASKGRKVRFHVHSKLVNFMAPIDNSSMNDEARTELYRCLFGSNNSFSVQR